MQSEAAFKSYLESKVGVPVYTGTGDQLKTMPCIIANYTGGTQDPGGTGNMDINFEVTVQSEIDQEALPGAMSAHDEIMGNVEKSLFEPDVFGVNAATDFHLFGVNNLSGTERDTDDTTLSETITLTAHCALGNF